MSDTLRNAYHEAGHAVLGTDHGRRVHRISLRTAEAHAGITQWEPDPPEMRVLLGALDGRHPLDGLMPDAFRFACRRMVETLAGKAAAELAVPTIGRQPEPLEERLPRRPPPASASVTPRLQAAEAAEPDPRRHDDDEIALDMAMALVGYPTTGPLLGWMRAEARRACSERWPVIESVASALLAAETLDAEGFGAIYQPPNEGDTQ